MRYFIVLFLFFCSWVVNAQRVKFSAICDVKDVVVNIPFKVSFVLENADVKNVSFPNFQQDGFSVVQGPMNESRYVNINGKASSTEAYVFLISAKKTGKFTLGPAKVVTTNRKSLTTNNIEINAVAAAANNASIKDNLPDGISGKVVFRMIPSTEKAVPGEQVIIDLKVYTQLDLASIGVSIEPKSDEVDLQYLNFVDNETSIDVINGKQYASKTIHRIAFTAGSPGKVDISPSKIEFVQAYGYNPFSRQEEFSLFSNALSIEVEEFKNQPSTFEGAVGKFSMYANIDKTGISSDDLLNLTLTVEGLGDVKKITEIPILFGKKGEKSFDAYPPKMVDKIDLGPRGKTGIKDFIYKLEPNAIGDFEIRPTFTFFDTELRRFVTIDTVIPVKVLQGKKVLGKSSLKEDSENEKKIKLSFGDAAEKANWYKPGSPFYGSVLFWILFLLPALIFITLAASKVYLKKRYEAIVKNRALTKANRELNENMKIALLHLSATDAPAFYHAIAEAFKNFLGRKLKIPKADLSKEMLAQRLEGIVEEDKIRSLSRIMKICELSVFAGQDNKQAMQLVYDESRELFEIFTKTLS